MPLFPLLHPATRESDSPVVRRLQIFVLFNGSKTTANALRAAAHFAADLGGDIVVAAPLLVPYPLPIEHPDADRRSLLAQISHSVANSRIDPPIHKVLIAYARDQRDGWRALLPAGCIVVVGKASSYSPLELFRSWSTSRFLQKQGYEVLFA